jgi:hypothetical protein
MVSAWSCQKNMVLGQVDIASKIIENMTDYILQSKEIKLDYCKRFKMNLNYKKTFLVNMMLCSATP